jgi:hypothetical protein
MNLTRPPLPRPPRREFYTAVRELHRLAAAPIARAFAKARFGDVTSCNPVPAARGLYAVHCATGRCYVALIGPAEIEGRGLAGVHAQHQLQELLIAVHGAPDALRREILVTPSVTPTEIKRAYIGHEALGRHVQAWVVSYETEWSTMALASAPLRRFLASTLNRSESAVYEEALAVAREHCPEFVAELLPYPPSAYQPALEGAIAETPARTKAYAREVVRATLSGERHAFSDEPAPRRSQVSAEAAAKVRRQIDATVNLIRHEHLLCGTDVQVECWEDEEIRPGTVVAVQYGASAPTTVDVDYPDDYSSPRHDEVINPSTYPLSRIHAPANPLHGKAAAAKHEPLERRRFH